MLKSNTNMWSGADLAPETHVFKKDQIMCSKYTNHSRFNDQHDLALILDFDNE